MKHKSFFIFLVIFCAYRSTFAFGTETIQDGLPMAVYLKTRTQTFNSYHYYAIKDGKIWYKSIDGTSGPDEWTLFMKTGLPYNNKRKDFATPKAIREIVADADELVAISDEGRLYRYCFDKIIMPNARKANQWYDRVGWPEEKPLYFTNRMENNIGWALGKRNSHVRYYEDIFGNQHHYGTMEISTMYVLLQDGQEICYHDTGLPSDFSRNILGPERGAFKAVGISASASTLFLINDAGEMYTRLADFDTLGCDPMFFKYTYEPYHSSLPGTNYRSNYTPWGLPSEPWKKQPAIPLTGKARLTKHITIFQNGMGNSARELRVGGCNSKGETGYWYKQIFEEEWHFKKAPLVFAPTDFLTHNAARGSSLDTQLTGYLWKGYNRVPEWEFKLLNFNILEGDCTLQVTWNGESTTFLLHPIEVWTYIQRERPGRDNIPKRYFVTLEVLPESLRGLSKEFTNLLNTYITPYHRKLYHFDMEATTDYAFLSMREKEPEYFIYVIRPSMNNYVPQFQRVSRMLEQEELTKYHSEELIFSKKHTITIDDLPELQRKIQANEALLKHINTQIEESKKANRIANRFYGAYTVFNVVTHATFLFLIDFPKIYTLTRFGDSIVQANREKITFIANTNIWLNSKLKDLIQTRISMYKTLYNTLIQKKDPVMFPPNFSETFRGYWKIINLPEQGEGIAQVNTSQVPAQLVDTPLEREFPGWFLKIGEDNALTCLVEVESIASTIFQSRNYTSGPFTFKGKLHPVEVHENSESAALYDQFIKPLYKQEGINVNIHWDGKTLIIENAARLGKRYVFFRSL